MNAKTKSLLLVAALVVVVGGATLLYNTLSKNFQPPAASAPAPASSGSASSSASNSSAGTSASSSEPLPAPDFTVEDAEGNSVSLSDFAGKPVVLNFWASWCPPCKAEMPEFEAVWQELGGDVVFMMINATDGARETKEKGMKYIADQGFGFPVYYDTTQLASYLYGITSLPSTAFIDADGNFITGYLGQISEDTLRQGIAMITPEAGE